MYVQVDVQDGMHNKRVGARRRARMEGYEVLQMDRVLPLGSHDCVPPLSPRRPHEGQKCPTGEPLSLSFTLSSSFTLSLSFTLTRMRARSFSLCMVHIRMIRVRVCTVRIHTNTPSLPLSPPPAPSLSFSLSRLSSLSRALSLLHTHTHHDDTVFSPLYFEISRIFFSCRQEMVTV